MKKILLGATALTFVGAANVAVAQISDAPGTQVTTGAFNLDVGGGATLGIGYVDSEAKDVDGATATDADSQPIELINNAEVHFNFSLVADNGLTFGWTAEFEASETAENVDEFYGFVEGSFGRVELGAEDGAADDFGNYTAGYRFTNSGDGTGLLFDYASTGVTGGDISGYDSGDGYKISYFTPTIAGFAAGVSYAVEGDSVAAGTSSGNSDAGEALEFGARYSNSFGAFDFAFGGGYTTCLSDACDAAATQDAGYTVGARMGTGGFGFGLVYGVNEFTTGDDDATIQPSISYATGPWFAQANFSYILENNTAAEEDEWAASAEVNYDLAPGVRTGVIFEYASQTTAGASESSGFATGLFLGLTF